MKNIVKNIDSDSPLLNKVQCGYELLSVNGNLIRDVLDYKYYTYEKRLLLEFRTPEGKIKLIRLKKDEGRDLGLDFEAYLMDRPRSCANHCVFCFIDQNPPGMRNSIYFKDDDARLSFLMGCYITLTNLTDREIQRIIDLRISPINISVHATDPALRERLLCSPRAGQATEIMKRFAAAGITMNCQIVCCPGWNDGIALLNTMQCLKEMYPAVNSVSVVPVGLTKYREGLTELKPFDSETAGIVLDEVNAFGDQCLAELGTRLFFCSDELYLTAGRALPPDAFYEGHVQLENGVGMLRLLEAEFLACLKMQDEPDGVPFSIATGAAAAPMIELLLETVKKRFPKINGKVFSVKNSFFGEKVTVAGLITGTDLLDQLRDAELGERLFISSSMLRRDEVDFLDSIPLSNLAKELGVPVYPVENDGGALCDAMFGILPEIPAPNLQAEETEYYPYNQSERKGGS